MSQQLVKKGANGEYSNVMPKSWIEAIKDKNTGQTLVEILQGFNMYFLSYTGDVAETRKQVPAILRKKGLWITYVKYDGNVYTEWYAADEIDDKSWGDSSNWRIGNNTLVGDITISANGNWVINGTETEFKAVGEKGNTPLIRVANNRLQVSYDLGDTYRDVTNNPVYTKFRWLTTSGDTQANNVGRIQASTDEGRTWTNMSNDFTNNLHIKKYIGVNESLPTSGIAEGTIYAKGPYYAEDDTLNDNPIYRLWVYAWKDNTLAWQDNGEFTSIAAGVVQETGDSETEVMSQKAVTRELSELNGNWFTISGYIDGNGGFVSSTTRKCTNYINVNGISSINVKGGSNEYNVALYALYDENKNFISSASGSQYDKKLIEVDIPDEAHFIRCTSDENGNGEYYGVSFLTIEREIGRIKESVNNNEKSINDNSEAIKNTPSELGFEPIIADYSVLTLNGLSLTVYGSPSMWDNGKLVTLSSTSYRMAVNEKIPVVGGKTYKVSVLLGDAYTSMLVHFWNSKTNQFAQQDVDSSTLEFATPDWCDTIMFTINKAKASDINNLDVTTYGDTGYYRNNKLIIEPNEDNKSGKLCEGKKVILFGDSQLGQARDYPSEKTNISVLLEDIVGGKVYNWGFGGCSMALRETPSTWDAFSMVSLADALVSKDYSTQDAAAVSLKSDIPYATSILNEMKAESLGDGQNIIICIAYGGNDYNNLCKLGKEDSTDKTTYKGAINYAVGKLLTAFPKAKICLVGVAYRVMSYTNKTTEGITADSDSAYNIVIEDGTNQHYYRYTYNNALLEQAKYLHIAGFDKYYRSGRNKYNIWAFCPNDGVHPESLAGRVAEAEFYASVLRSV